MKHSAISYALMIFFFLNSCKSENEDAVVYFQNINDISNRIAINVNQVISEIGDIQDANVLLTSVEYKRMRETIGLFGYNCKQINHSLDSLGAFESDSTLYLFFKKSLTIVEDVHSQELALVIDYWEGDSTSNYAELILFDALAKMANSELERIEELQNFKKKYSIKYNTQQLKKSREKYRIILKYVKSSKPTGCIKGDCLEGYGEQEFDQGSIYKGNFKNGMYEGEGKIKYYNGDTYTGNFHEDNFEGFGIYEWKDGDIYKGEWKNNDLHGTGTMIWSDGDSTYGIWENGDFVQELETMQE